jgi:oligopeptide transport system ATP-binding protein
MSTPLLEVKNLKQYFPIKTGLFETTPLKAVDDVSFALAQGETLGLVGESGCGKTTVGRTILHLYKPTAGQVFFEGTEITKRISTSTARICRSYSKTPIPRSTRA